MTEYRFIPQRHPSLRLSERGIALVFSLLVLLVLTLLGVSALRTSALEQLMSGSTQEMSRAFQAADSGLAKNLHGFIKPTDLDADFVGDDIPYGYAKAKPTKPQKIQNAECARSSTPTGGSSECKYYDQGVTGFTATNARAALHQGLSMGAPVDPNISSP